jgi:hypothetical protein
VAVQGAAEAGAGDDLDELVPDRPERRQILWHGVGLKAATCRDVLPHVRIRPSAGPVIGAGTSPLANSSSSAATALGLYPLRAAPPSS